MLQNVMMLCINYSITSFSFVKFIEIGWISSNEMVLVLDFVQNNHWHSKWIKSQSRVTGYIH